MKPSALQMLAIVTVALWHQSAGAATPVLLEPANGTRIQATEVALNWQAAAPPNLITNGSFESGTAYWNAGPYWTVVTSTNAFEGSRYLELPAQFSNRLPGGESFFLQEVRLPATGGAATLTWVDRTSGGPLQTGHLKVEISTATSFEVVHDVLLGENTDYPWGPQQVDLTAYLGRSIYVAFVFTNRTADRCYAALDDVRLQVTPAETAYEVYVGPRAALGPADLVGTTTDSTYWLTGLAPGSTNFWRITQISDGKRATSPVFSFVAEGFRIEAPILRFERSGDGGELRFGTQSGVNYVVEASDSLASESWQATGEAITGDGLEAVVSVPLSGAGRFFRVCASP